MATRYHFGDINTLDSSQVRSAVERAERDITDVLDVFLNDGVSLGAKPSVRIEDLNGYYADVRDRLEELGEAYFEKQGEHPPKYEGAIRKVDIILGHLQDLESRQEGSR